jgi:hypothetical protein
VFLTDVTQLGLWVVYEVTRHENIKDRVTSLATIIDVAEELLTLKDFSSVLAIASGLNNASLTRLKKTFAVRVAPIIRGSYGHCILFSPTRSLTHFPRRNCPRSPWRVWSD